MKSFWGWCTGGVGFGADESSSNGSWRANGGAFGTDLFCVINLVFEIGLWNIFK